MAEAGSRVSGVTFVPSCHTSGADCPREAHHGAVVSREPVIRCNSIYIYI